MSVLALLVRHMRRVSKDCPGERMNSAVEHLVAVIVSEITRRGGWVTKTKLLKLIYLFDVEYFRRHRQTFTGFSWKFLHLGPWAAEFDATLPQLLDRGVLTESTSSKAEFDTTFYRVSEATDISSVVPDLTDELLLKRILDIWSDSSTGEILDYIYFRTEPMEHGVRNQPLDFGTIRESTPKYVRPPSGKTPEEIKKLRKEFRHKLADRGRRELRFTPPRYDKEFFEAMSKLNEPGR